MIGQESGQLGAPDRAVWRTLTLIRLGKRRTAPTASPSGGRPVTGQPMEPSHARVRVPPGGAPQERRAARSASPRAEPAYGQGAAERLRLLPRARRRRRPSRTGSKAQARFCTLAGGRHGSGVSGVAEGGADHPAEPAEEREERERAENRRQGRRVQPAGRAEAAGGGSEGGARGPRGRA